MYVLIYFIAKFLPLELFYPLEVSYSLLNRSILPDTIKARGVPRDIGHRAETKSTYNFKKLNIFGVGAISSIWGSFGWDFCREV
jgi:hypothetical protein